MRHMIRRRPTVTALLQDILVTLPLLLSWPAGAQDAASADRTAINTRAHPGNMMADSPVTFPKQGALPARYRPDVHVRNEPAEKDFYIAWDMTTPWAEYIRSAQVHPHLFYRDVVHGNESGEQILSKILMAFWAAPEPTFKPDKVNGEAIYGTRPWLVYGEGPTRSGGSSFSEGHDQAFSARDIRFTTKGDALYAITLGWPDRQFTLQAVRADAAGADARVELLGHGVVSHRINAQRQIVIDVPTLAPAQLPCQYAFAFKLSGFRTSVHSSAR